MMSPVTIIGMGVWIEAFCSKPQGIFDRKERCHFVIRSLTQPQVADAP
jgi:hypothetical protein